MNVRHVLPVVLLLLNGCGAEEMSCEPLNGADLRGTFTSERDVPVWKQNVHGMVTISSGPPGEKMAGKEDVELAFEGSGKLKMKIRWYLPEDDSFQRYIDLTTFLSPGGARSFSLQWPGDNPEGGEYVNVDFCLNGDRLQAETPNGPLLLRKSGAAP